MSFQKHTKAFGDLLVANSLIYDKGYKDIPRLQECILVLPEVIKLLKKKLKVSKDLQVILRPIRAVDYLGRFCVGNIIELDPRTDSLLESIEVLCHEFVHAEQYHLGKLVESDDGDFLWMGQEVKASYMDLPWEKEAYLRAPKLTKTICKHLNII
jgi:hypothetical protein